MPSVDDGVVLLRIMYIDFVTAVNLGVIEAELRQRAQLNYTRQVLGEVSQTASAAAGAVRQARLGLRLTSLIGAVMGRNK